MMLMPSCPEVRDNMTEYLEGTLPFSKRVGIRLHLMMCHACNALRKMLLRLPGLSKQALEAPSEAPPEAKQAYSLAMAKIRAGTKSGT